MKLKPIVAIVVMIAGLDLCSYSAVAQPISINKPAGDPPVLELDSWKWGGPFNLLVDKCKRSSDAEACFIVGKNYVLAAGGFQAYKGVQENIANELDKIVEQEHTAIDSLNAERKTDSETLAQMQNWATQAQNLATAIHAGAQKDEVNSQWGLWFLNKGCMLGSGNACADLTRAFIYREGGIMTSTNQNDLERYCSNGIGSACDYLGNFYLKGEYLPMSAEDAAKYYELGCGAQEHNLHACRMIAKMYEAGDGVSKDPAKAKMVYRYICMQESDCEDLNRLKKVVSDDEKASTSFFDLGRKLFPDLYKDYKDLKDLAK